MKWPIFTSAIISIAILMTVGSLFGFYYEDNQVVVVNLLYYACPNEMLLTEWMNDFDFLLIPFWALVCQKFNTLPVYAVWQMLQLFLWIFALIYYFLKKIAPTTGYKWVSLILYIIIFVALTLDSMVSQICVRNSTLIAGAALLYTYHALKNNYKPSVWVVVLFVFALIPRSHPVALVLSFFMCFEVLTGLGAAKVIRSHAVHIVASVIIIGSYQLYGMIATQNTGKIIEAKYEYATLEKHSFVPISEMKTLRDSTRLLALKQFFISDTTQLNLSFIGRAVNADNLYKGFLSVQNFRVTILELILKFKEHKWLMLIILLSGFISIIQVHSAKSRYYGLYILLAYVAILSFLLLNVVDELKDRFFVPFTSITALALVTEIMPLLFRKKCWSLISVSTLIVMALAQSRLGVKASLSYTCEEIKARHNINLLQPYTQKIQLINSVGVPIPFCRNIFYRANKRPYEIAWFDAGYMVYYPYVEARFINTFGCSGTDMPGLINLLEKNRNLRLWAVPERTKLFYLYFKNMYGIGLHFVPDASSPVLKDINAVFYKVEVNRNDSLPIPSEELYKYDFKSL